MRSPILILFCLFVIVGCRKDPVFPEPDPLDLCLEYDKTSDSYDYLVVTEEHSTLMYQKILPAAPHSHVEIDIDCDGLGDFRVNSSASVTYNDGHTNTAANVSFECLNEKLSVLTHLHTDSIYSSHNLDTIGTTIYSNWYEYDYNFSGSALSEVRTSRPVQGVSYGDTVFADSPDWRNGQFSIVGHNTYLVSGQQDAGNGYYMYYELDEEINRGTIQNDELIVIKYETEDMVKMGYISFNASASYTFASFAYHFIRINR